MYRKRDASAKLLFCLSKGYFFVLVASALLSVNKTTTTMTPTVSLDLVLFRPKTSETRVRVQALWGALAAGQQKEGELATTSLGFDFTSNSRLAPRRLSCQISSNQRKAETSTNVNKY